MIDIAICILGIIGLFVCRVIENAMWDHEREKVMGYELKYYCGVRNGGKLNERIPSGIRLYGLDPYF